MSVREYDEYYAKTAPHFDRFRLDGTEESELFVSRIRAGLPSRRIRAFDAGCGSGRHSYLLSQHGLEVVSLDRSIQQLRVAPKRLNLVRGSVTNIPFRAKTFGVWFSSLMIHQLDPFERNAAFSEAVRILEVGGKVIIRTSSHDDLRQRPFAKNFPSALELNLRRYPDIPELRSTLSSLGLVEITVERTLTHAVMTPASLMASIRSKPNTTLSLVPADEFASGCGELEKELAGQESTVVSHYHTILTGSRGG